MSDPGWVKTVLLSLFAVALGATATLLLQSLGMIAIALLWLALGMAIIAVSVYTWRSQRRAEIARSQPPRREIDGDGTALVDVLAVWKTRDGKRHKRVIKKGEKMPRVGEGDLKDAVEGWHESIK